MRQHCLSGAAWIAQDLTANKSSDCLSSWCIMAAGKTYTHFAQQTGRLAKELLIDSWKVEMESLEFNSNTQTWHKMNSASIASLLPPKPDWARLRKAAYWPKQLHTAGAAQTSGAKPFHSLHHTGWFKNLKALLSRWSLQQVLHQFKLVSLISQTSF